MVEKLYCNWNPRVLGLLSCSYSWFLFSSYFAFSSFFNFYFIAILLDFALFLFFWGVPGFLGGVPGFIGVFLDFLGCSWFSWECSGFLGGVPGFRVFRNVHWCSGVPVFLEVLHAFGNSLLWINTSLRDSRIQDSAELEDNNPWVRLAR